jgi:hypothetical protein
MAERKAYHQLGPIRLSLQAFDALPLRQEVKGEAKDGQQYRDAAYPNEVFVWKAYDAPVKGEWTAPSEEIKDPERLPDRPEGQNGLKDGVLYRNAKGVVRAWRAYPKGQEIKGEWLMAAVDIGG